MKHEERPTEGQAHDNYAAFGACRVLLLLVAIAVAVLLGCGRI